MQLRCSRVRLRQQSEIQKIPKQRDRLFISFCCIIPSKAEASFSIFGRGDYPSSPGDHLISRGFKPIIPRPKQEITKMMMTNSKTRLAVALLVPALLALAISEAAAQKQSASAARAECFRQANEAAAVVNIASTGATAERNARGVSAYRECARRMGIRP
jgi:hypothetical protein